MTMLSWVFSNQEIKNERKTNLLINAMDYFNSFTNIVRGWLFEVCHLHGIRPSFQTDYNGFVN